MGQLVFILLVIGGLNWGLIGFFGYDVIAAVLGDMTTIAKVFYALIGLAALYELFTKWGAKK